MSRAAIYCRLSEEDRDKASAEQDSESIQNQKAMLTAYAERMGWEVYRIYSDDDFRGSDRNRPAWNELLRDAEKRRFDVVLCKSQSRFTRELEIVEKYLHGKFVEWNIRFVGLVDNADTSVRGNKKARQINGLVNEWYLEDLSENERAVFRAKQQRGEFIGTYEPYGYRKSPADHNRLVVDDPAAAVVRRVFAWYLEGEGTAAIARRLNAERVPTPADYKAGRPWRAQWRDYTVRMLLTRQVYAGDMVQGMREKVSYKSSRMRRLPRERWAVVPGTHAPIVSREDFFRVRERMGEGRRSPRRQCAPHPLAGRVVCARCGGRLQKHRSKDTDYLQCAGRRAGSCDSLAVRMDELNEAVLGEIRRYFDQWDAASYLTAALLPADRGKEAGVLRERLGEYDSALAALYLDRSRGLLEEGQFEALARRLREGRAQCGRALRRAEEAPQPAKRSYAPPQVLTPALAEALVERVEVEVTGKARSHAAQKTVALAVYWRF